MQWKTLKSIFQLAIFSFLLPVACKSPQYLKFDPDPPGLTPKIFAKEVIAKNGEFVGYCSFSPDGKQLYYAVTNKDWFPSHMIRISADRLSQKDTLYLKDKNYEGEPFVTKDGNTLYFTAVLPPKEGEQWNADIFRVRKTTNGWSSPERLDSSVNTKASEWHISIARNNAVYFTSEREEGTSALHGDIYRGEISGDKILNVTKLPSPINTKFNDSDPLIAQDESYLIFHSDRPGGFGQHDLYISFNKKGKWTNPVNMGSEINSPGWEMAPTLTPDGKYLLYTYRKEMVTKDPARIYWVSTRVLKKYKP